MRKRSSSFSSSKSGIVCTDEDLRLMMGDIGRRKSVHGSAILGGKRKNTTEKIPSSSESTKDSDDSASTKSLLEVKPRKRRTRSLQPDTVNWDSVNNIAVQPELIGSLIENYLTNKRSSSGNIGVSLQSGSTRPRTSLPGRLSVPRSPTSRTTSSNQNILGQGAAPGPSGHRSSKEEKRIIVVDEFDHPRRLSFGSHRKISFRQEESVESALKKMNI